MKLFSSKVMSGIFVCLTFFSFSCSVKEKAEVKDYVSYVDPYIGSGAHGHVFVGANVPFGAVQVGPQNISGRPQRSLSRSSPVITKRCPLRIRPFGGSGPGSTPEPTS